MSHNFFLFQKHDGNHICGIWSKRNNSKMADLQERIFTVATLASFLQQSSKL
jgi:hypothetical protein